MNYSMLYNENGEETDVCLCYARHNDLITVGKLFVFRDLLFFGTYMRGVITFVSDSNFTNGNLSIEEEVNEL